MGLAVGDSFGGVEDFLREGGQEGGDGSESGVFAEEFLLAAERRAARQPSRRLDPPLLAVLDEAPSIVPLPGLPALVADGRGRGITVVYAMQSFSQAVTRWGASRAETMANATNVTVVFGGLSSAKDLADLERVCGSRPVQRVSLQRGGGQNGRSETHSWEHQPVLPAADIRTLPAGTALVLWGRLPPILARFPLLSQDRGWKTIKASQVQHHNDAARIGGRP